MLSCRFGHVSLTQILLRHGANVHARTPLGNSAMHWASLSGQESIVQLLASLESSLLTCRNINGDSPMMWASTAGSVAVVDLIDRHAPNEKLHCNREG
jgi:ankyrin repeat protein